MKRDKVFAITKGFRGRANNCFRIAHRAAEKALEHEVTDSFSQKSLKLLALQHRDALVRPEEYRDRKTRKREMRTMWIERINAGAREHGLKYGDFIHGMKLANIELDRKVLADICVTEPPAFQLVCQLSRDALIAKYAPNGVQQRQVDEATATFIPRVVQVDLATGNAEPMDLEELPAAVREHVEKRTK